MNFTCIYIRDILCIYTGALLLHFSHWVAPARPRAEALAIAASAQRAAEDARTRCHWVCYSNLARGRAKPERSRRGTRKGDSVDHRFHGLGSPTAVMPARG